MRTLIRNVKLELIVFVDTMIYWKIYRQLRYRRCPVPGYVSVVIRSVQRCKTNTKRTENQVTDSSSSFK